MKARKPSSSAKKSHTAAHSAEPPAGLPPSTSGTPQEDSAALEAVVAATPAITEAQREAFRGQFSDADCDAFGAETVSSEVLSEGIRAVVPVVAILNSHGRGIRYSLIRLRYLVETLKDLRAAVEAQSLAGKSRQRAVVTRDQAAAEVTAARNELLVTLQLLAGRSQEARDELDRERGSADTAATRLASLRSLASLCERWIARPDAVARALVLAHNVTQADADDARRVADAFERAESDVAHAPTSTSKVRDTPATNRVEGRVLYELDALRVALDLANGRNKVVPVLKLGATLRRALRRQSSAPRAGESPSPAPDPPPVTR